MPFSRRGHDESHYTPQAKLTQSLHGTPLPQLAAADGQLTQIGWSRQPLLDCHLENARIYSLRFLQRLRIKRWDYYCLLSEGHSTWGNDRIEFTPDLSLGNLDWGSGFWDYCLFWVAV